MGFPKLLIKFKHTKDKLPQLNLENSEKKPLFLSHSSHKVIFFCLKEINRISIDGFLSQNIVSWKQGWLSWWEEALRPWGGLYTPTLRTVEPSPRTA